MCIFGVGMCEWANRLIVRHLLRVLLACVLVLPVAGLLWLSLRQQPERTPWTLVPMLSRDARRSLPTYQESCRRSAECDPPLGCFISGIHELSLCTDSECETDGDCGGGRSCLPFKIDGGNMVRLCALNGERREGEKCRSLAEFPADGCTRGLLCQGRCGRPCRLDDAENCPVGFFCAEGGDGPPSCLPTCAGRSCPEGLSCLPREGGVSICSRMMGSDCRGEPCPDHHACRVLEAPGRPWELRTECRRRCDARSPCPDDAVCRFFECRARCDPRTPDDCGPGLTCGRYSQQEPLYCIPG